MRDPADKTSKFTPCRGTSTPIIDGPQIKLIGTEGPRTLRSGGTWRNWAMLLEEQIVRNQKAYS